MNYATTINFANRREGFEPEPTTLKKLLNIKETHIKILSVAIAIVCGLGVYLLQHI